MKKREELVKRVLMMLLLVAVVSAFAGPVRAEWLEQGKILVADSNDSESFGRSVFINGDYSIIGDHYGDGNEEDAGAAFIFYRLGKEWIQLAKLTASDGEAYEWYGDSVTLSGSIALVGAWGDNDAGSGSGSAYLYDFSDPCNIIETKLTASDAAAGDGFGISVSISGDYAIIGASGDDIGSPYDDFGSAYIFTPSDVDPNNWVQQAKLTASDGADIDNFGCSVFINGDLAIVGAKWDDMVGSAYIFKRNGTSWVQIDKLIPLDSPYDSEFGSSVSMDGDYAIVGAPWDTIVSYHEGSAYIFMSNEADPNNWDQMAKLTGSDIEDEAWFGSSISISGNIALVGAPDADGNEPMSGAAYIFTANEPNDWNEQKLIASDGASSDGFEGSVSISGNTSLVGAWGDSPGGSTYVFMNCVLHPVGDLNGDCEVDLRDFVLMARNWLVDCIYDPSDPACVGP